METPPIRAVAAGTRPVTVLDDDTHPRFAITIRNQRECPLFRLPAEVGRAPALFLFLSLFGPTAARVQALARSGKSVFRLY